MEVSITTTVIAVAVIQLIAIIALLLRSNRDVRKEIHGLNERVEKQSATIARLNDMIVTHQQGLSTLNEMVKTHQDSLQQIFATIDAHQKNIAAMERRIVEVEKVGDLFKTLFDEIPVAIDKYNKIMDKIYEESLAELEKAQASQDLELIRYQQKELESIEVRKRLIGELPGMMSRLMEALGPVNERLKLFSGRDKYPTGSILSYPSRRAKSLLFAIGEQATVRMQQAVSSAAGAATASENNGEVIVVRQEAPAEAATEVAAADPGETVRRSRRAKKAE